jgi:Ser/Thr protein kinase RdoA (MazF antagonist)
MGLADPIPVIRSIVSPDALLERVVQSYAIATAVDCRLLKRGLNDTYLLRTQSGPYVVRVYRAWRSGEEIQYELDLLRHLSCRGVAVSVPIAARGDRLALSVTAPEGIRYLALFTYADGSRASWTDPEDAYRMGSAAAAIHAASDDFTSASSRTPLDLGYLIDAPLVAIRPFFANRPADWPYLEQFGDRLRNLAMRFVAEGLDWGVCHGDFGPKNIHRGSDGRLTTFDFDLCGPGWRAFDLGLMQWVAMDHKEEALWEAFLTGYTEIRPLSAADFAAVPVFHAAAHLSSLGLFAENIGDWGAADMNDWLFDRELEFFRAWEAEHA